AKAAADTELAYVKAQYPAADWSLNDLLVDHDYYDSVWAKDIALLKLATPLSQVSHATLEPTFNPRSNTFPITNGQDVTFRGWGVDENGTRPRVMNKTTVSFVLADYDYLPNNPNGDGGKGACANDGNQCDYIMRDRLNGYATTIGSTPYTGDSGTPLVIDGTDNVVAFAKSTNGTVSTQFTHLGFYFDIIREAINQVAAPKSIEMEVESGYAASETKTFMVQNLTASSETLSP
ncbi:trypsin-like serine protease, partial [Vibrio thalassae]